MGRLEGAVAIVTGASGGLGSAIARLFIDEGAQVVLGDLGDDAGAALAQELGPNAHFVHCNVCEEADVAGLVDTAVTQFGKLDIMVNNAGILGALGSIDRVDVAQWDETIAVHLRGTMLGMKHAARVMKPAGKGAIVSTASVGAVRGGMGPHAYSTAKAGIVHLTKCVASELRAFGIRVNCVSPTGFPSPMTAGVLSMLLKEEVTVEKVEEELTKAAKEKGCAHEKALTSLDVAKAVLYLASDVSGGVSGHNLVIDMGHSGADAISVDHPMWSSAV